MWFCCFCVQRCSSLWCITAHMWLEWGAALFISVRSISKYLIFVNSSVSVKYLKFHMCSWNTLCGLKDLELEEKIPLPEFTSQNDPCWEPAWSAVPKEMWEVGGTCLLILCLHIYGCTRNGSSSWRTSPPFFISSHLLGSNRSHCAVLQQVPGKNIWLLAQLK